MSLEELKQTAKDIVEKSKVVKEQMDFDSGLLY